ncbi:MAG: thioredoxin domain-containing protein [Candidatus Bathyarchaeota archaeon]|nr:thioredoxin domain-containing protein [Candidatus Bathyarchaeota archaeon]
MASHFEHKREPNRLIHEKSPYLLQHAYNPVDWYPWSQEAFDKAKAENKPIFVSIGYASCHWCHVMEKECFEDEEVAKLLNDAFVCVKVDREERPDLDAAYMAVCQAMGKNCGWPLNILMTPRLNPFFAASYIPKISMRGSVGMMELVPQVMEIWRMRGNHMEIVGADIKSRIEGMEKRTPENELGSSVLEEAYEGLARNFDWEHGGFGTAPKFPRPHSLLFMLRYWKRSGAKDALGMAEKALRQMRLGGIFDQIGFGFHRYSTDAAWLVPHFEKMLYDQALLALAYTEMYQATGADEFKLTAKETLEYALRDLASPQGGFYSSQDADSEGEEGKFYLWTLQEVVDVLDPADADLAVHLFGLSADGNYFDASIGKRTGKNILHLLQPLDEVASAKGLTADELIGRLGTIQSALFEARKRRVPPATDDKVLTDWNGLMVAALAKASSAFGEPRFLQAAFKTADFLLADMRGKNGALYHRYAKGERAVAGFLDDYAFLVFGLIELYEVSFDGKYLQAAVELTQEMNAKFWDDKNGGYYLTSAKPESGMPKMKQVYDGAFPSGNSVALHNLLRLSRLTNDSSFEMHARMLVKAFSLEVQSAPEAFTWLLAGVDFAVGPSFSVVLVGEATRKDTLDMLEALKRHYLPTTVVSVKSSDKAGLGYAQIEGAATAYVCRNQTCLPPTNRASKMLEQLGLAAETVKSN